MNKQEYFKLTRTLSDMEIARGKAELAVRNAEAELRVLVKEVDGRSKKSTYYSYNGRLVRCEPCYSRSGRYNIYVDGKRLHTEYRYGLDDIRLHIAIGRL
jgi:hypothetical protein